MIVTDGAWGTELQARGLAGGECPDAWNLTHPDEVAAIAAAYAAAGSQIVLTNTFRANRIALAGYGLADHVAEINRRGVELSRRGAAGRAKVFASIGPCGKLLAAGEVSEDDLRTAFEEQTGALAAADGIVVETMSDIEEARIAVAAAKATGLPVVGSMVFDSGRNKDRTMTGATPEQAAAGLSGAGADIIGANCGCGIEAYIPVCARLRAASGGKPVWIKANAGLPQMSGGRVVYRMGPEEFAAHAVRLVESGAEYVGGCCGTNPAFIAALCGVRQCV